MTVSSDGLHANQASEQYLNDDAEPAQPLCMGEQLIKNKTARVALAKRVTAGLGEEQRFGAADFAAAARQPLEKAPDSVFMDREL